MTDRSNGYQRVAAAFLAGCGGPATAGIGATAVRTWAQTLPAGATVLDLGCGSGLPITEVLINAGLNVYALDASKTLVAAFRARFPDTPVACEPVEDSAFFHRSFDAVVAWGYGFFSRRQHNGTFCPGSLRFWFPKGDSSSHPRRRRLRGLMR